jgi:hypothetical protein
LTPSKNAHPYYQGSEKAKKKYFVPFGDGVKYDYEEHKDLYI